MTEARFPQLAVACPRCEAPADQLCTSHGGTRTRTNDTHTDRTKAHQAHLRGVPMSAEQRLLHLADRVRRGVLLLEERELLADGAVALVHQLDEERAAAAELRACIAQARALATQWAILRAYGGAAYELRAALGRAPQHETAEQSVRDEDDIPICTCTYGQTCPVCPATA